MFHPGIDLTDILALATIIVWPVIPLFWIPVHGFPKIFRKIGIATYIMPLVLWLPLAYFLFMNRFFLLTFRVTLPGLVTIVGLILMVSGTALQIWTGKLLRLRGLMGLPEITRRVDGTLVTEGAFSVVRHPTYLSHTLMFAGVFLISGVTAAGVVTLLDFLIVNLAIIPLEERELSRRFGPAYEEYRKKVPKFFPRHLPRKNQR